MAEDYGQMYGEGAGVRTFKDITVSNGYEDEKGFHVYVVTPGSGTLKVRDLDGVEHTFTGISAARRITVDGVWPLICQEIIADGSNVTTVRVYRNWQ